MVMKKNSICGIAFVVFIVLAGGAIPSVQAATLTYTNTTNFFLSSPGATLSVVSGSVADGLTVNATSVVVTLSSSTGGTFAITSALLDLTVATSGAGGVVTLSCNSGVATMTLSQSTGQTIYVVSPSASPCSSASSSPTASGGGATVSVSSAYGSPYTPGTGVISTGSQMFSSTSSDVGLLQEIASLQAQLVSLRAQIAMQPPTSNTLVFTRNLYLGLTGRDVQQLQMFLIAQNKGAAARKLAVHGSTEFFGKLTSAALIEFQKYANIVPAIGYFGPVTRAYIERM